MKTFNIYKHSGGDLQAVKIGFSWVGFLFAPFWLLIKKLWIDAAAFWFALIISPSYETAGSENWWYILIFVLYSIAGFKGNKIVEGYLINQGYKKVGTAQAGNKDSATAVYVRNSNK